MTCDPPDAAASWIPEGVFCPREKILEVVLNVFLDGIDAVGTTLAGVILDVFGAVETGLTAGGGALYDAGEAGGSSLLLVLGSVQRSLVALATGLGFAAPVATVLAWAFVVAVTFALLRAGTWAFVRVT